MMKPKNRALSRAVMLGLTALCLVTVGVAATPAASAHDTYLPKCVGVDVYAPGNPEPQRAGVCPWDLPWD